MSPKWWPCVLPCAYGANKFRYGRCTWFGFECSITVLNRNVSEGDDSLGSCSGHSAYTKGLIQLYNVATAIPTVSFNIRLTFEMEHLQFAKPPIWKLSPLLGRTITTFSVGCVVIVVIVVIWVCATETKGLMVHGDFRCVCVYMYVYVCMYVCVCLSVIPKSVMDFTFRRLVYSVSGPVSGGQNPFVHFIAVAGSEWATRPPIPKEPLPAGMRQINELQFPRNSL